MARPICCWTVIAALLQLYCESTASHDLHICKAFSSPTETHQIQLYDNIKLIKFDGIRFPYNSSINSLSTPAVENNDVPDKNSENSSTSEEVTQTAYSTTSTNETTTKTSIHRRSTTGRKITTRSTRTTRQTHNLNSTDTLESRTELRPSCRCQIESADYFMIKIVKVWFDSHIPNLNLQVNNSGTEATRLTARESWNQTFQDTTVTISIADDMAPAFYTVIVVVTGNVTSVTCEESKGVLSKEEGKPGDGNKQPVVKANPELLFEAPLLLIGGALAVIGSLLCISGIAVWRRYRKEHRRRRAKCAKAKRKRDEHQGNSYEMCTFEREPSVKTSSTSDDENSQRKLSVTSVSRSGKQQASLQSVNKSPTSSKSNHETKAGFDAKKKQDDAKKKNKCANDKDNGVYSEIEQEYEDISEGQPRLLTIRDTRVATPLVFVKPGEQRHALRKTNSLDQATAKTRSLPPTELQNRDNVYSHLDRQGNLPSHCLRNENRDSLDSNNIPACQTIDVRDSSGVFNVDRRSSDKPKQEAQLITGDKEMVTSDREEDEQDHIYEAYEEQEDVIKEQDNLKHAGNGRLTTESQPATGTLQSTEGSGTYQCKDIIQTSEVIPQDLTENKRRLDDNVDITDEGTKNTESETILQKHKSTEKESSLVTDNPRGDRPESKDRHSAASVERDPKEHQADINVTRKSQNGIEVFNNYDTNDQTHTTTPSEDPQEATLISDHTNITPAERSVKGDRQLTVEDLAIQNEIRRNKGTSNKDIDDSCDINKTPDLTEASECLTNTQPQANCNNTPSTAGYVNVDSNFRVSDVVNQNEIPGIARMSVKDTDIPVNYLIKPDATLSNSNLAETNTTTQPEVGRVGNTGTCIKDDITTVPDDVPDATMHDHCSSDSPESYTVVDNIVYGAWPLTEL